MLRCFCSLSPPASSASFLCPCCLFYSHSLCYFPTQTPQIPSNFLCIHCRLALSNPYHKITSFQQIGKIEINKKEIYTKEVLFDYVDEMFQNVMFFVTKLKIDANER
jgi:hypothetical protein